MFEDREHAGRLLADKLKHYKNGDVIVLAIPRGGLPLGAIVAERLNAPLDVALSKKIGHPYNKEYAIGAVTLHDRVLTDATGVTKAYIEEETLRVRKKLRHRHNQYYRNRKPLNLRNKTVLIVDDGMATGNTILVTIALVATQKPARIVGVVPVASKSSLQKVRNLECQVDVVCLETPINFRAVGLFYHDFPQVSDKEAIALLENTDKNLSTELS